MKSIHEIIFWSGRILFALRRLISFAITSRKINKLKKRQRKLIVMSVRLRTTKFRSEIADLEQRTVDEMTKFVRKFGEIK